MTAIKKTTSKSAKSPTPATKGAKPASKKTASAALPPEAVPAGGPAVVITASGPTVKTNPAAPAVTTTVTARIDIGFGNSLFIRGEGPGLSWDKGVPMTCLANDEWQISLAESPRPFLVKFLINDTTWSTGPDYTVPSGVNLTLAPQF